jgi:hypothetical protein
MSHQAQWEYVNAVYARYHHATVAQKSAILDECCATTGYHRKYAIRVLNGSLPPSPTRCRRVRRPTYDATMVSILAAVWEAASYPWSAKLKALLPGWLPWIRQRFRLSPALECQLLTISPRQIDRRLQPKKTHLKRRLYGRTKPGTLLKHHIPIKTDHWDVCTPGFTEIDLVSHSGDCADGEFIHSLNQTDILTTWGETRAVMGKGQHGVCRAIAEMREAMPFELLGIDSDNGSEFINAHLYRYCQQPPTIQFTRGRPYKKDDNAHIEQKNWTHVRKLLGYARYDSSHALAAMNDLYCHELRLMMNLFQPSIKLRTKVRVGSKLVRRYDIPQTPLDRLIASGHGKPAKIKALQRLRTTLDPFKLAQTIEKKLTRISALAHHRMSSKPGLPVESLGVERRPEPSRTHTTRAPDASCRSYPQGAWG